MGQYVDAEGKPRQVLNITQRMLLHRTLDETHADSHREPRGPAPPPRPRRWRGLRAAVDWCRSVRLMGRIDLGDGHERALDGRMLELSSPQLYETGPGVSYVVWGHAVLLTALEYDTNGLLLYTGALRGSADSFSAPMIFLQIILDKLRRAVFLDAKTFPRLKPRRCDRNMRVLGPLTFTDRLIVIVDFLVAAASALHHQPYIRLVAATVMTKLLLPRSLSRPLRRPVRRSRFSINKRRTFATVGSDSR